MNRLSERRVATQDDLAEASTATELNRMIRLDRRAFLAGTVAAAVDQTKDFAVSASVSTNG